MIEANRARSPTECARSLSPPTPGSARHNSWDSFADDSSPEGGLRVQGQVAARGGVRVAARGGGGDAGDPGDGPGSADASMFRLLRSAAEAASGLFLREQCIPHPPAASLAARCRPSFFSDGASMARIDPPTIKKWHADDTFTDLHPSTTTCPVHLAPAAANGDNELFADLLHQNVVEGGTLLSLEQQDAGQSRQPAGGRTPPPQPRGGGEGGKVATWQDHGSNVMSSPVVLPPPSPEQAGVHRWRDYEDGGFDTSEFVCLWTGES